MQNQEKLPFATTIEHNDNAEPTPAIEEENLDPVNGIKHPFDPQLINIIPDNVNLGSIIENLENDEIDLSPAFQRKSDLWNNTHKSRLIESLILGLPLPTFFFANEKKIDMDTGKEKPMLVVVDGLQRLCTIKEFVIDKTLHLSNLEFLGETHTGKSYNNLSREEQRKIKGARITLSTIHENNPPLVKFIVFRRINTGGLPLNQQEIRHALNQGSPANFLTRLARSEEFISATGKSVKQDRMLDCEFINRFLAFYLLGHEDNYGGDIDLFLAEALVELSKKTEAEIEEIGNSFIKSMKCSIELFGDDAFRKPRTKSSPRRKAISKAIFDTISTNLAHLEDIDINKILKNKDYFSKKFEDLFSSNTEFTESVSNATGTPGHVFTRFNEIKKLISEVLSHADIINSEEL